MDEPTGREILDALLDFRDAVGMRFDQSRAEMNARFDQVDARFDRLDRRVTNLETRVDDGFTRIDERFAKLEARRRR